MMGGTSVSSDDIAFKSQKARMAWLELDDINLAPKSFCKMSKILWDFF